ncbi:hypothetical protein BDU57DRAFT_514645 [Ampelomyces quisqualis]|uniref:Uncharacterized protein n=1 Tax=Ampelomyces quisqualis TaxID=50730 RepID=A0A6A5QRS3_AMPQU|nr:hypothetical protein BDU57DRAFT_514645 [Ampelomyces quisqualis]
MLHGAYPKRLVPSLAFLGHLLTDQHCPSQHQKFHITYQEHDQHGRYLRLIITYTFIQSERVSSGKPCFILPP